MMRCGNIGKRSISSLDSIHGSNQVGTCHSGAGRGSSGGGGTRRRMHSCCKCDSGSPSCSTGGDSDTIKIGTPVGGEEAQCVGIGHLSETLDVPCVVRSTDVREPNGMLEDSRRCWCATR